MSWLNQRVDVNLSDELVSGYNAEEDGERVEASVDDIKEVEGDIPAVVEIAEKEPKDEAEGVQDK
jgi:hypothetical protein